MKLYEKKQRSPSGVHYTKDADYAVPVTKKDVPPELVHAIEGEPIEKTNGGFALATVPDNRSCGCFGGKIFDNTDGECPWLYIFIPPTIQNPDALNYTRKAGRRPAQEIPNMTQARKRQLRAICDKVGWKLDTEDLWGDSDVTASFGDSAETAQFYKEMAKMHSDGWHSWLIIPKNNIGKPEKWELAVGQQNAIDQERKDHYRRKDIFQTDDDVVASYDSMKSDDDEFVGFGRVTESTKVTLSIGQLKRLIEETR